MPLVLKPFARLVRCYRASASASASASAGYPFSISYTQLAESPEAEETVIEYRSSPSTSTMSPGFDYVEPNRMSSSLSKVVQVYATVEA